ncbi:hypothetical protein R6Y95_05370 [Methanoculleus palmolei]|uniref:Transglutaminase-like domain-containing protein n=1 Tax=Methanoculleus palmolei TaxID=72612 RepID=A0ABD8A5T2_9EURY|nr:hypothetical protein R6Y95_05370 [Methanoculleus palmolei]
MDLAFDESLFKKVIGVLVIAIAVVGVVAVLWFSGIGFPGQEQEPAPVTPDPYLPDPGTEEEPPEETPAGPKSYNWSYQGAGMTMDLYIPEDTYERFLSPAYGSGEDKPQRMAEYVVTDGDDGVVDAVADWFLATSRESGFGDSDTVSNVLAFVASLNYTTDAERLASADYSNYPVVTLAGQGGDSEDHAILAAAILDRMGYGVSLLYYPATHDRRTIIPEATALGLVTDGTIPGRLYWAVAEAPAGRFAYFPENGTYDGSLPASGDPASGWFSGEAVWQNATGSGTFEDVRYYPANRTFVAGAEVPGLHTVVVEDAVWNQPIIVSAAWAVNTTEKGVDRSAYDGMDPFFNGGDGLWLGHVLSRDDRLDAGTTVAGSQPLGEAPPFSANESLTAALRIPVSDPSPPLLTWLEPVRDYYTGTWYPAGISWTYDDKWRIHDNFLEMRDPLLQNREAYSLWGVTEVIAPVPWRVAYTVQNMDEDRSDKEMTPYSDVRFALYRIEDGAAVFDRTFGWQTVYGADMRKNEAVFGPGDYALAVFVRNCEVDVTVEYHGKPAETAYHGGI